MSLGIPYPTFPQFSYEPPPLVWTSLLIISTHLTCGQSIRTKGDALFRQFVLVKIGTNTRFRAQIGAWNAQVFKPVHLHMNREGHRGIVETFHSSGRVPTNGAIAIPTRATVIRHGHSAISGIHRKKCAPLCPQ
ncbi:hypothetical protein IW261DRAFT_192706 [Armillaria novae-zelandiae]|uniref:Uncharacterized protein n=1 Tax=Armillaria novae-zelandiae TaxID=153914 RepID=A0AA39UE44_9AGAR|nr:hypothetical protein IW261DRAFT_192706 [Armillaria novae-zelandiae]